MNKNKKNSLTGAQQRSYELYKKTLNKIAGGYLLKSPQSEVWFDTIYNEFRNIHDFNNVLYKNHYIPDIHNTKYMYVIEVDGGYHLEPKRVKRDAIRDAYFRKEGYATYRVKAFNPESAKEAIQKIVIQRELIDIATLLQEGLSSLLIPTLAVTKKRDKRLNSKYYKGEVHNETVYRNYIVRKKDY